MTAQSDVGMLQMAELVSQSAQCTRRSVGAVLTTPNGFLIGAGSNKSRYPGMSCLEGDCPRGTKTFEEVPSHAQGNHDFSDCIADHAEVAAMAQEPHFPGSWLYVTCEPCRDCWSYIKDSSRLQRVIWPEGDWIRGNP